ncbi:hypothetical protein QR680_009600 [Steinernema hermaphroditum]|uniref:UBA domain-containing protein n=1 Tax=Steinernema hermaphroditum TaxID=289476 RepID=A0AA39IMC0_9BILA|nr:hypothetical protein QR680_009600 [Steinernema hermaphroditum]
MGGKGSETFAKQPKASSEQIRMAKMTQNAKDEGGADERRRSKLVKKIMEATRCSQMDAEVALFDADNNVDAAVLAIIEKAEEENSWTESKSRKARKDEKFDQQNSTGRPSRPGRPGVVNGERRGRGSQRGGAGNARGDRSVADRTGTEGSQNVADRGAPRRGRGGRRVGHDAHMNGGKSRKQENPDNRSADAFSKNDDSEEFNWHSRNKDKPLVFTRSEDPLPSSKAVDNELATTSDNVAEQKAVSEPEKPTVPEPKPFTGCAAGPISFAAAAAGRRVAPTKSNQSSSGDEIATKPPGVEKDSVEDDSSTPVVYQSALLSSSVPDPDEVSEPEVIEDSAAEVSVAELSLEQQAENAPIEESLSTEKVTNEEPNQNQSSAQSWEDKPNTAAVVSAPAKELASEPAPVQNYEFFKGETTSVLDTSVPNTGNEMFASANTQPRAVDAAPPAVSMQSSNVPSEASPESKTYINRSVGQQLSYGDTKNLSFPPEAYAPPQPARQQPQQSQHQHPVYPPQVPYGNFPYMNPMYNPMNNLRSEDQYNAAAAFMHNYQSLMGGMGGFDMNALAAAAMNSNPGASQQQQQRHDNVYDHKNYHGSNTGAGAGSNLAQQRPDNSSSMIPNASVPPPPGFSGPPSNMSHYMQPPQQNLASLFAMPPQYPTQLPFSFLMPNVSGNSQQHKVPSHLPSFHQDENTADLRLSGQQQKAYGQQSQMDKYGASGKVDRMGQGAQSTPPPQMGYGQPHGNYMSQMHGSKKGYNHHNWNS